MQSLADKLADIQGGCGICGCKEPGGRYGTWNVDHCHKTGAVRGVLCWECNVGIGKLKDDPNLLRRAIQWLEQSEQPELSLLKQGPMESLCIAFVSNLEPKVCTVQNVRPGVNSNPLAIKD